MEQIATKTNQISRASLEFPIRYCLYARKSSEAEDKQALSIESQIKEMQALAQKENLEIAEIKRESHSSKEVGQRAIFNQMLNSFLRKVLS